MKSLLLLWCLVAAISAAPQQWGTYLPPPPPPEAPEADCVPAEPVLEVRTVTSIKEHQVTNTQVVPHTQYRTITTTVPVASTTTAARTQTRRVSNTQLVRSTSTQFQDIVSTLTVTDRPQTVTVVETSTQTRTQTHFSTGFVTSTVVLPEQVVSTTVETSVIQQKTFVPRVTTRTVTNTILAPGNVFEVTSDVFFPVTETRHLPAVTRTVNSVIQRTSFATETVQAPQSTIHVTRTIEVPQTRVVTAPSPAFNAARVTSTVHTTVTETLPAPAGDFAFGVVINAATETQPSTSYVTVTLDTPVTTVQEITVTSTILVPVTTQFIPSSDGVETIPSTSSGIVEFSSSSVQLPVDVLEVAASPVVHEVVVTSTLPGDCQGYDYSEPTNRLIK